MSDVSFKPGDVVNLKSGGPKMTVTNAGDDMTGQPFVSVTWFDGEKPMHDSYHPASLDQDGSQNPYLQRGLAGS